MTVWFGDFGSYAVGMASAETPELARELLDKTLARIPRYHELWRAVGSKVISAEHLSARLAA